MCVIFGHGCKVSRSQERADLARIKLDGTHCELCDPDCAVVCCYMNNITSSRLHGICVKYSYSCLGIHNVSMMNEVMNEVSLMNEA